MANTVIRVMIINNGAQFGSTPKAAPLL